MGFEINIYTHIYVYACTISSDFIAIIFWPHLKSVRLTQQLQFLWSVNNNTVITAAGWLRGQLNTTRGGFAQWKVPGSHCYGSGCQADFPHLEVCLHQGCTLAGCCCVLMGWVQLHGVHEPHHVTRDQGDSPAPLWCRGNIFQEEVEPPELPSNSSTRSPSSSHLSNFCSLRAEVSSTWPWDICSPWQGQGWATWRQLSLQGGLPLGAIWHCLLLLSPAPWPTCAAAQWSRWIQPAGWDAEDPRTAGRPQCCKWGCTTWSLS